MKKVIMAGTLGFLAATVFVLPAAAQPFSALEQLFGKKPATERQVILAQATDPELRIQQLEEQVRQLNGRIEEMSFQLLQMQETLRKSQEDNEFRFQELEKGKKSGAIEAPAATQDTAEASGDQTPEASQSLDQPAESVQATPPEGEDGTLGAPPKALGEITFDANGNIVEQPVSPGEQVDVASLPPPVEGDKVGEIIKDETGTAPADAATGDGYQAAYEAILAGDYANAETLFRGYIDANPQGPKVADASFWLGEAQYSQGKYSDSAKTFLNSYKAYQDSPKAPEMLLKLAMSLAALDSKDTACATLRQVTKSYPKASRAIVSKVASEQKRLAC